jgi:hypothetical protein
VRECYLVGLLQCAFTGAPIAIAYSKTNLGFCHNHAVTRTRLHINHTLIKEEYAGVNLKNNC